MTKNKTIYIWDFAGTLFREDWDSEKTGFPDYESWLENKVGKKIQEISPRKYEEMYEEPYKEGWYFHLDILPGFKEVLEWTENNEAFTTGNPEQIDWRAEYINPRAGFDVRKYFKKINSTFDYAETNQKTTEMLVSYLQDKYNEGYRLAVYTDDKLKNLRVFAEAADSLKEKHKDFSYRLYNVLNNNSGLKDKGNYYEIGNLFDLLKNEKAISK